MLINTAQPKQHGIFLRKFGKRVSKSTVRSIKKAYIEVIFAMFNFRRWAQATKIKRNENLTGEIANIYGSLSGVGSFRDRYMYILGVWRLGGLVTPPSPSSLVNLACSSSLNTEGECWVAAG